MIVREPAKPLRVTYDDVIEAAIAAVEPIIAEKTGGRLASRWLALKLLDYDDSLIQEVNTYLGEDILQDEEIVAAP